MDPRTRARIGRAFAVVLALLTCATVVLALVAVYGLAAEYGGGMLWQLGFVVLLPVVLAGLAALSWPGARPRHWLAAVLGTAVVMFGGGLAADALGADVKRDRLQEGSRDFSCNGSNSVSRVPARVDRTWEELPRRAPIYGPVEGSPTDCVAAVSGDGATTFADHTETFRGLEGWKVRVDEPQHFVMVRDDVQVTVRLLGAPDRLTTIEVGLRG